MRKAAEDFIGTCPACLGEFKVAAGGTMALHGYRRPGVGHVVGPCEGVGHPPFEHACDLTRRLAARHRRDAAVAHETARRLAAGEISRLVRHWSEWQGTSWRDRRQDARSEEIGPDSPHWAGVLAAALYAHEADARFLSRCAAYMEAVVATWTRQPVVGIDTPPSGRMRGLRDAYDPDRAEARERLERERSERAARPGKLKLVLFWDAERGDELGAEMARIRAWIRATFPAGKPRVLEVSGVYDIPLCVRKADSGAPCRLAVLAHLDWSHRDDVARQLPGALPVVAEPKRIEFAVDVSPAKPWNSLDPSA